MQEETRLLIDFPLPEERIFRYQAMQDILHHLVNNPLEQFTQKELAQLTGADISSVSRSIDLLEELGVLDIIEGMPKVISLNQNHIQHSNPVFTVSQTQFRAPIRAFLEELETQMGLSEEVTELVGIILFGSVARGTADRSSDIDLLVIAEGDLTQARRIGSQTARELEEQSFDGDRYEFEVLVETPKSAATHGNKLREIFDEGIILERTDALSEVRLAVYNDDSTEA